MKRFFALSASLVLLLVAGLAGIYWQIRNVDPEGACKDSGNFSMCWDAWFEYRPYFKVLPSDQEMIDSFKKHRGDFDEIRDKALSQRGYMMSLNNPPWKARVGHAYQIVPWTPSVYSSPRFVEPASTHEWSWEFHVDETMYIAGARKNWPHVNRLKGYAYFPLPAPRVEQGRLLGPMLKNGQQFSRRVLEQLDGNWPADWASYECLLRRIEPQWFLFICKDHIGG